MTSLLLGSRVLYTLNSEDVLVINARRFQVSSGRTGTPPLAGDVLPAIVVNDLQGENGINLQVFLDGNDSHWVTNVLQGEAQGRWHRM